ncbi:unnamed protein product [Haemonchus placei]|uniref:Integrase catalytic domain-containing protein n=1 Tax=Haemonchus placei TaxID=6290 RepID=A0A0N4X399_HAEPC|nr:unnamed protein product [Haemonchus placei]
MIGIDILEVGLTTDAEIVAQTIFVRQMTDGCRFPGSILSNQCGEFDTIITQRYNPRENELTERFKKTIVELLRKKVDKPVRWDEFLSYCMIAYNPTPYDSTGESPFFLLHGYGCKVPAHWSSLPKSCIRNCIVDMDSSINEQVTGLEMIPNVAREQYQRARERMKQCYDE